MIASMVSTIGGVLIAGVIFIYILDRYGTRGSPSYERETHLSWKMLKNLYAVNHNRWKYTKVIRHGYSSYTGWNKVLLYNGGPREDNWERYNSENLVRVNLSFPSWLKFQFHRLFWKDTTDTEFVLESVQRDIDKLRAKATAQINEANSMMEAVQKRISSQEESVLQI